MAKFIRIPLTEALEKDSRECAEKMDNGQEKECDRCSLNGGEQFECLGEFPWCMDDREG